MYPTRRLLTFTLPIPKRLDEVARVPLLKTLSPTELRSIWLQQFASNPRILPGVMSAQEHALFTANLKACPIFLVPVRRSDGAQFTLISQRQSDQILLFTLLENFRQNPTTAPPYLVMALYDDLLKEKHAALLRADIVAPDLSRDVAGRLVKWTREFYTDPGKFDAVKNFNLRPREFDWGEFVERYGVVSEE
jgi:ATP synthase F1 complex assembly factor 1